ncbi:1-acyl-sn-glycerol-3-phosphate acyltransferase [Arundinibacter roseus]|uniref:Glycerol acyltransferase n=1 Tax=Arundinibacter roseus TaxID=2070510 RepID=A0A4R4KKW6_9BACT|nr:1-acyl-sn-glycerol-3-phosphate acyltransferase [Arundinibacter roseus]TDB68848.1 glycerol acyltransferase [Arundinibacter roseus]
MLYYFSRFLVRLALPLYVTKLCVRNKSAVPSQGPILLASNHSGSFFDAVIIGGVLSQPIHTLTRGDVFRKPKIARLLRGIKLIPVFRGTEGRENLKNIDTTLDECFSIMRNQGTVVIFSEGVCVNEWKLRPLGKGTARMAYQAWFGNDPALHNLPVVPTGVTYEHFRGANKRVVLDFRPPIYPSHITTNPAEYEKWLREFNALLRNEMCRTIFESSTEEPEATQFFAACSPLQPSAFLRGIGALGRAINRPLYRLYTKKVAAQTKGTVFYDSVLFGLLMYTYPVLVSLLALLVGAVTHWAVGLGVFLAFPLGAWAGNQFRPQPTSVAHPADTQHA